MNFNQLIKKQIDFQRSERVGTVLSPIKQIDGSSLGSSPINVVDIDIGSNRVLKDVLIKASGSGSYFYAEVGSSVILHKNTKGLYDVIGPADRIVAVKQVNTYDFGILTPTSTENSGFSYIRRPYSYFAEDGPLSTPSEDVSRYGDGTALSAYNIVQTLDGDGNVV